MLSLLQSMLGTLPSKSAVGNLVLTSNASPVTVRRCALYGLDLTVCAWFPAQLCHIHNRLVKPSPRHSYKCDYAPRIKVFQFDSNLASDDPQLARI